MYRDISTLQPELRRTTSECIALIQVSSSETSIYATPTRLPKTWGQSWADLNELLEYCKKLIEQWRHWKQGKQVDWMTKQQSIWGLAVCVCMKCIGRVPIGGRVPCIVVLLHKEKRNPQKLKLRYKPIVNSWESLCQIIVRRHDVDSRDSDRKWAVWIQIRKKLCRYDFCSKTADWEYTIKINYWFAIKLFRSLHHKPKKTLRKQRNLKFVKLNFHVQKDNG